MAPEYLMLTFVGLHRGVVPLITIAADKKEIFTISRVAVMWL